MPAVVLAEFPANPKTTKGFSRVYLDPGQDGAPEGYAAVRFTVPKQAGGYFRVEAEVGGAFPGLEQGDTDFHVVIGGRSDYDRFLIPHEACGYTNSVFLEEGATVDFVVGRGADGRHRGSRLLLNARLCRTAGPEAPVFSRVRPLVFDLAQDFIGTQNSNGVWRFGTKKSLADPFTPLTQSRSGSDIGVRLCCWADDESHVPALCQIAEIESAGSTNTISRIGGVYWTLRRASEQSDYGIARLTVPPGFGGAFRMQSMAARPVPTRDIPFLFHVIINESNVLTKTNVTAGFVSSSAEVHLLDGDVVDFVVRLGGRGPGGLSSVDLMARLTALNDGRGTNGFPTTDGPTANWSMNGDLSETRGRAAFSAQGSPSFVPGLFGQALHFDGKDDTVSIQACGAINVGERQGLTVEFWIRPASLEGWGAILEWTSRVGPLPGMHIFTSVNGPGNLFGNLLDTSGTSHSFSTIPGVLSLSRFQHVALTYDRRSGLAKFYLDGCNVATESLGSFTPDTVHDLWLGRRILGGRAYRFRGDLDEVSLYDRPLQASEVQIRSLGISCLPDSTTSGQARNPEPAKSSPMVNRPPIALPHSVATSGRTPVKVGLIGFDLDGDALTYAVDEPAHGTLSGTPPDLVYEPSPGFVGLDTFTFTVSDGRSPSTPAQISVLVRPSRP